MKTDKLIFYIIAGFYSILLAFGALSLLSPDWLLHLSSKGRRTEAITITQKADRLMYASDWKNAASLYELAIRIDDTNKQTFGNLGVAYTQMGEFSKAKSSFDQVLALSEGMDALANFNYNESMGALEKSIGDYLDKTGKDSHSYYLKAAEYYKKAIDLIPFNPVLHYKYASLLMNLQEDSMAIDSYRQGINHNLSKDSDYREVLMKNYLTFYMKDDTLKQRDITSLLNEDANWNKFDTTIFLQNKQKDQYLAKAYFDLGVLYSRNNNAELANDAFQNAFEINPELAGHLK